MSSGYSYAAIFRIVFWLWGDSWLMWMLVWALWWWNSWAIMLLYNIRLFYCSICSRLFTTSQSPYLFTNCLKPEVYKSKRKEKLCNRSQIDLYQISGVLNAWDLKEKFAGKSSIKIMSMHTCILFFFLYGMILCHWYYLVFANASIWNRRKVNFSIGQYQKYNAFQNLQSK